MTELGFECWSMIASWQESYDKPKQCIKKQRHHFANKGLYSQSYGFSRSHVWMWEQDHKKSRELILSHCGVGEDSWESLGQQEDQTRPSWRKSTMNVHWKDWCWSSNTLAMWCKEQTHWKRPWCWERLKAEGEEGNSGWDGWTASLIQQTWMWANSGKWWDVNREAWCAAVHGVTKSWTRLRSWTELSPYIKPTWPDTGGLGFGPIYASYLQKSFRWNNFLISESERWPKFTKQSSQWKKWLFAKCLPYSRSFVCYIFSLPKQSINSYYY